MVSFWSHVSSWGGKCTRPDMRALPAHRGDERLAEARKDMLRYKEERAMNYFIAFSYMLFFFNT